MSEGMDAAMRQLRDSPSELSAKYPDLYVALRSLADDYLADRLPLEARERLEALRDEFSDNARDTITDFADGVKGDSKTFVDDLLRAVDDYQQERPDLDVKAGEIESDLLPKMAEPMHEAVDVVNGVVVAVEDVVRDAATLLRDMVDVRADNDPDGRYAEMVQAAQANLDALSDSIDVTDEDVQRQMDTAHENIENAVEWAEGLDVPVNLTTSRTLQADGLQEQQISETEQTEA